MDLVVEARTAAPYRVYIGRSRLEKETAEGRTEVSGRTAMVRGFPRWMEWSSFAEASRQVLSAVG